MDRFRLLLGKQYTFEEDCIMDDSEAEVLSDLCATYAKRIADDMKDLVKVMNTFPEMKYALRAICRVKLGDKVVLDCVLSDTDTVREFKEYLNGLDSNR